MSYSFLPCLVYDFPNSCIFILASEEPFYKANNAHELRVCRQKHPTDKSTFDKEEDGREYLGEYIFQENKRGYFGPTVRWLKTAQAKECGNVQGFSDYQCLLLYQGANTEIFGKKISRKEDG